MTRSGVAYEQPTWAPPTAGSGSSSSPGDATLLPTPRATDGTKGGPNQRGSSGDLMLPSAVNNLLPTQTASDTNGTGTHGAGGADLRTTVSLLPTPQARDGDGRGASHPDRRKVLNPKRAGQLDEVAVHLLLPTPTARDGKGPNQRGDATCLHGALLGPSGLLPGWPDELTSAPPAPLPGASTSPPSEAGSAP
jgi:hypothetical protein